MTTLLRVGAVLAVSLAAVLGTTSFAAAAPAPGPTPKQQQALCVTRKSIELLKEIDKLPGRDLRAKAAAVKAVPARAKAACPLGGTTPTTPPPVGAPPYPAVIGQEPSTPPPAVPGTVRSHWNFIDGEGANGDPLPADDHWRADYYFEDFVDGATIVPRTAPRTFTTSPCPTGWVPEDRFSPAVVAGGEGGQPTGGAPQPWSATAEFGSNGAVTATWWAENPPAGRYGARQIITCRVPAPVA